MPDDSLETKKPIEQSTPSLEPDATPAPAPAPVAADLGGITAKPKAKPKAKPLIEGINTPRTTNDVVFVKPTLTENEEKLISETADFKPIDQKFEPKFSIEPEKISSSPWKGIILVAVVVILVVFGAYGYYSWKLSQQKVNMPVHQEDQSQQPVDTAPVATSTDQGMTSTTPFALAGMSNPTPTSTPAAVATLKVNSTPTGFLNVRSSASTSGNIVAKVHPGETYTYTAVKSGWYNISLPGGSSGWVTGQYVTVQK